MASGNNPQLLVNYEKILSKNLILTNDLNDRDNEIIALKKREQVFDQTLKAKEKMYVNIEYVNIEYVKM